MNNVSIIGVGQTPVGEHWDKPLRAIAVEGIRAALTDAGIATGDAAGQIDAIVIGNALGGSISGQHLLGALVADFGGMRGVEAVRVEAADASGGAALRHGYLMVASGAVQTVLVLGVEKVTDSVGSQRGAAMLSFTDSEYEGAFGTTPVALAALLMRRYMHTYGVTLQEFAGFSVNAHANASKNQHAMFRNLIKAERFASAPVVADPVNLFDAAPEADGAAAVILTTTERAADRVPSPVRILASAAATDSVALQDRADLLFLLAANLSAGRAYAQAGIKPADLNFIELHDSSTILSTLALEAIGLAARGQGWRLAVEGQIQPGGRIPMSTFGGLKARGNPFGATGVYQAVEATLQLRGQAGAMQLPGQPQVGLIQNVGGLGATAVTHILGR